MMRPIVALSFTAAAIIFAGCAPPADPHAGFSVTDSAGVYIANNDTPLDRLRILTSSAANTAVSIGVEAGEPSYMFNRISDATRLETGHIVVVDESQQLRIFDSTGKHVVTHGRKGQGPGEFLSVSDLVAQRGDTFLVWDEHAIRYSSYSVSGGFLERQATRRKNLSDLLIKDYFYEHFHPVADGSLIVEVDPRMPYQEKEASRPAGVFSRLPKTLVWVDAEFSSYRKLGERGGLHQAKIVVAGRPEYFVSPLGFYPSESIGGDPQRICIDALEGAQVNCFTADGRAIYLRWHMEPMLLPDAAVAKWIDLEASRAGSFSRSTPEQTRAALSSVTLPTQMASVTDVVVDAPGFTWVRSPDLRPDSSGTMRYRIFDRDGQLTGLGSVPAGRVMEIGADHVLTLSRNMDGIERIVVSKLTRKPTPPG